MKKTRRYLRDMSECPLCHESTSISNNGKTGFRGSRGRQVFTCTNPYCRASTDTAFWINGEELTEEEYKKRVRYNQRFSK